MLAIMTFVASGLGAYAAPAAPTDPVLMAPPCDPAVSVTPRGALRARGDVTGVAPVARGCFYPAHHDKDAAHDPERHARPSRPSR